MPKSYSASEREQIVKRLKHEAKRLIAQYGVKKTSVDELVKSVNIPKGTFYLFYSSKELLIFDAILEEHEAIQKDFIKAVAAFNGQITQTQFSELMYKIYQRVTKSFLYPLMTNGDLELVIRKLPDKAAAEHAQSDDFAIGSLFKLIPQAADKNIALYSAAFRGIFLMALHENEIGEEVFDNTIKFFIDSIAEQLFKGETT